MSIPTTVVDEETGEEKKRLINKMRWKGYGPAAIMFSDAEVPTKPPANVEEVREQHDQRLLKRLEEVSGTLTSSMTNIDALAALRPAPGMDTNSALQSVYRC